MRTNPWPLAPHLAILVLASAVPCAWVAAALAASLYTAGWQSALALTAGVMALALGAGLSFVIARELDRMLEDLASEARLLARGLPLTPLQPVAREGAAIADALAAAAARVESAPAEPRGRDEGSGAWRWDLVNGTMHWNGAANCMFRLGEECVPSLAQLMAVIHAGDRAPVAAWLAALARGADAPAPCDFRIACGDGEVRRIRARAMLHRDADGTLTVISGSFDELAAAAKQSAQRIAAAPLVEAAAARLRERAAAAGLDVAADHGAIRGSIHGDGPALEQALARLVERAVMSAPRGGSIALLAAEDAASELRIVLSWAAPGLAGMGLAGGMVELKCGLDAAKIVEDARAAAEACGGTLVQAGGPAGETVTITLPLAHELRDAA